MRPVPAATTYSGLSAPQRGQAGPGGCRSAPQSPQRWIRNSPASAPAQKNAVSGLTTGRIGAAGGGGGPAPGRNLRTRNRISATGSPSTSQVLPVVTNQPSPSAVRLGPATPA